MYHLSSRSRRNLQGVDPALQNVVMRAIQLTKVDFAVIEGLRTLERQKELVAKGASQTLKSKHLEGKAVDLMAYEPGGKATWSSVYYDDIADAMSLAASEFEVGIRWGAAWHIPDITLFEGTSQEATDEYVRLRVSEGKKPFLDFPHFELTWQENRQQ